jgi:hypothetical protein
MWGVVSLPIPFCGPKTDRIRFLKGGLFFVVEKYWFFAKQMSRLNDPTKTKIEKKMKNLFSKTTSSCLSVRCFANKTFCLKKRSLNSLFKKTDTFSFVHNE